MKDESKTKKQLINELVELREQTANMKNSEEEFRQMKESNEKFVKAFMHSAVPMALTTFKEGRFIDVSNAFLKFTGLRQDEVIGHTSREIGYITEEQRTVLFHELKKKGCVENLELTVGTKGGEVKNGIFNAVMMTINNEKYLLKVMADITERKKAEYALRESEETYRGIFENAVEGIYQTTPEGQCLSANPAFARILGYESPAELMGTISDIGKQIYVDPPCRLEIKRLLSEHGIVRDFETQFVRKDKNKIWVVINANVIRDEEGNILGYQGFTMDITEKKRLENQLLQARKMEAVGTVAGGVVRDFDNLLLAIQECVSLILLDIGSSHNHYKYLKIIEAQVACGADLTEKLLSFTRGERYAVKPTNINEVIEKTSFMFEGTKKEIFIYREYGRDLGMVAVDRDQMEQVFMNLYENSWQAMPGGGNIYVRTENFLLDNKQAFLQAVKEGRYVKISVADTGTGMDESTKERIFDPFFTTNGRGASLGLATVYGIIKGYEGMITVYSEPGQGTTFTIYLPALNKEVATQQKEVEGEALKDVETILVVDDEKMVLDVTKELLESLGYQVYIAQSGQEAIDVYIKKRNLINLVILDMILPGMSGGKIFDRLREINPDIRVLLSSGYCINGEAERIMARGCNGFLPKPFRLKDLAQNVRQILD